jgi:hypothetical protein
MSKKDIERLAEKIRMLRNTKKFLEELDVKYNASKKRR